MKQRNKKNDILGLPKKKILILIGRIYKRKRQYKTAEVFYEKALDNTNLNLKPRYYYEYADVLLKSGKYKKALVQVNNAIDLDKKTQAKYFVLRAEVYIKLKKYADAEKDVRFAIKLENNIAFYHYILGIVLILHGKWHEADQSLQIAHEMGYKTSKMYRRLGQVSFAMAHYKKAKSAYSQAAELWGKKEGAITKSDLYYLTGLSSEKAEDFKASKQYYKLALENDEKYNSKDLGIGIFHEVNKQYSLAIDAYKKMTEAEPLFRLAVLYEKIGEKEKAVDTYKKVLGLNQIESKYHFKLGVCYEELGNYKEAAVCYKQAIARNSNHSINWYLKLLNVLDKLGENSEYRKVLSEAKILTDYVSSGYRNGKNKMSRQARYNMFREKLEIVDKTILFESMSGNRFSGNPLAIFKYMLDDSRFKDYTFIWTVNDKNIVPKQYKKMPNVIVVKRYTSLFYKYLSTASVLINNVTFPHFFMLKEGQKYLNTWHGTPWKTLGYDVRTAKTDYANTARNFLQTTHLNFPNQYTYDRQMQSYQVESLYSGQSAITGYPRIDLTYQTMKNPYILKEGLNINDGRKVILYAPTWRGENAFKSFDREQLEKDLGQLSGIKDSHVIFRGHHLAENLLRNLNIPNVTVIPEQYDTNELLGIADILITDYSSVFFDFLVTNKPIIHYVYDYETYVAERGLYFGLDDLPGQIVQSTDQLIKAINNNIKTDYRPTQKYIDAKEKFVSEEDGNSTKKTIEWLIFEENISGIIDNRINTNKKKILFHAGSFQPNGITSAFINLVNAIDKKVYDITVILSDSIVHYPERLNELRKIEKDINIIPRNGTINFNEEGEFAESVIKCGLLAEKTEQIFKAKYKEEYKRLFGQLKFDNIVDYSGYSPYYNQLLVSNPNLDAKRIVYVHNDIYSEYISRHPNLYQIFKQYKEYDKLLSVSEPTSELNKQNLCQKFSIPESKFDYIDNVQDPETVLQKSTLRFDNETEENLFLQDKIVFLTIGRLSAEKDQEKLIRAFETVNKSNPNTMLLIMGEGPLKHHLQSIIDELGMEESILLLGRKANPYPYLRKADCFVLPSNYEGQPVVLFEALILGKPIIATDIVSNRGVLQGGFGELCDNSIDGLVNAMNHFIAGELHNKPFDIEKFNKRAIEMFYEKVL